MALTRQAADGYIAESTTPSVTGDGICALLNITPKTARRVRNGEADEEIGVAQVVIGDRFRVSWANACRQTVRRSTAAASWMSP